MSFWTQEELEQLNSVTIISAGVPVKSPGTCKITPSKGIPRNWQTREGYGLSGATQSFRGLGLAEFTLTIHMWETAHRPEFTAFDAAIEPSPLGAPEKVYRISNPILAQRGVTQCVFLNAPFIQHNDDMSDDAIYECRQSRKPLPTLTSPTAAGAATPEGAAADAYQTRIQQHLTEIDNLLGANQANAGVAAHANQFLPGPRVGL